MALVWNLEQEWFIVSKTSLFTNIKELLVELKNIFVVVYRGIGLNGEYVLIYNLLVPTNACVIY